MNDQKSQSGSKGRPQPRRACEVIAHVLKDDGSVPNNARLPLLVYRSVLSLAEPDPAAMVERTFSENDWNSSWRNGIFGYHHYHSTAHEALGVYNGSATVQFGGEKGVTLTVTAGDVIIIPAGVGHKNLGSNRAFGVVGAYPAGQMWDLNYGRPGERPKADENIARVPLPETDPVFGKDGPLFQHWAAG